MKIPLSLPPEAAFSIPLLLGSSRPSSPLIELLINPVTAGIFGVFSLIIGKRLDSHLKGVEETKAEQRKQEISYKHQLDERHNKLFEAFVVEQKKAAVAFEGIHQSVTHIGQELAEMRLETRTFRSEIFSRINHLEDITSRHEGILLQMDKTQDRGST